MAFDFISYFESPNLPKVKLNRPFPFDILTDKQMNPDLVTHLAENTLSKILLVVADGLGDLPHQNQSTPQSTSHSTPLATAKTPNLHRLAKPAELGSPYTIAPGNPPDRRAGPLGHVR